MSVGFVANVGTTWNELNSPNPTPDHNCAAVEAYSLLGHCKLGLENYSRVHRKPTTLDFIHNSAHEWATKPRTRVVRCRVTCWHWRRRPHAILAIVVREVRISGRGKAELYSPHLGTQLPYLVWVEDRSLRFRALSAIPLLRPRWRSEIRNDYTHTDIDGLEYPNILRELREKFSNEATRTTRMEKYCIAVARGSPAS